MLQDKLQEYLTFDDVMLLPAYSELMPAQVDVATRLTRRIQLRIPLLSAAMDSVTESAAAIAMARSGGLGVIHRNLTIADQVREVERVKRAESGMILQPVTVSPNDRLQDALAVMREHNISGVPVVDNDHPVGILTARDIRFAKDLNQPVRSLMTKELVTVPPGVSSERAKELLHQHRIEKLLVVEDKKLVGLITIKDLLQADVTPDAVKDAQGRLIVGAAIGTGPDRIERSTSLAAAGVDVLVIDTAHGHSRGVLEAVKDTKKRFPDLELIAGNVATADGARALIDAGVDAVKTGIGPGCFAAGTRVLMADTTYKNIEDVREGDRVINMHGQPATVVKAWQTGVREVIALRHMASFRETRVTPDHRFLITDQKGSVAWNEIGTAADFACLLPKRIEFLLPRDFIVDLRKFADHNEPHRDIRAGYELGYLFGSYLNVGRVFQAADRGSVTWHFDADNVDAAEKTSRFLRELTGIEAKPVRDIAVTAVSLDSPTWARLFAQFARDDATHLPSQFLSTNPAYLRGLLDGLLDSDLDHPRPLVAELFGVLSYLITGSFRPAKRPSTELVDYQVVTTIERRSLGIEVPVYDIEVDCPTHSFIADNAIVHNSICTTRVVAGVGVPQITAVAETARVADAAGVPIVSDGGVKYSGDVCKAIAAGASTVMIGSLFAGTDESPGDLVLYQGRSYKVYRGMGSIGAMRRGSKDRYGQVASDDEKLVPEGIEGRVPYRGPLASILHQMVGGLRAGMGYTGTRTIDELRKDSRFIKITAQGLRESHVHDVIITEEAPNYRPL